MGRDLGEHIELGRPTRRDACDLFRSRGQLFFPFCALHFPLYIRGLEMAWSLASSKQSDIKVTSFRKSCNRDDHDLQKCVTVYLCP
jgi:hypothetical protein